MNRLLLLLISTLFLGSSCIRQVNQMKRFGDCEFTYIKTDSINFAGIPMDNFDIAENLSLFNVKSLLGIFMKGKAPLTFKVYLQAKNDSRRKAMINQMDWILFVDEKKAMEGRINEKITVMPKDSAIFAIDMHMDAMKVLRVDNINTLMNLMGGLTGVVKAGEKPIMPVKVKVMVKPSFVVGKKVYNYHKYITIIRDYEFKP